MLFRSDAGAGAGTGAAAAAGGSTLIMRITESRVALPEDGSPAAQRDRVVAGRRMIGGRTDGR